MSTGSVGRGNVERVIIKGAWKPEEDDVLKRVVDAQGPKNWTLVADLFNQEMGRTSMTGRTGKQCRERWIHHLRPDIKTGMWTEEEDRTIVEAHKKYQNKWREIAKLLPGRTETAVKNHWNSTLRQKESKDRSKLSVLKAYIMTLGLKGKSGSGSSVRRLDGEDSDEGSSMQDDGEDMDEGEDAGTDSGEVWSDGEGHPGMAAQAKRQRMHAGPPVSRSTNADQQSIDLATLLAAASQGGAGTNPAIASLLALANSNGLSGSGAASVSGSEAGPAFALGKSAMGSNTNKASPAPSSARRAGPAVAGTVTAASMVSSRRGGPTPPGSSEGAPPRKLHRHSSSTLTDGEDGAGEVHGEEGDGSEQQEAASSRRKRTAAGSSGGGEEQQQHDSPAGRALSLKGLLGPSAAAAVTDWQGAQEDGGSGPSPSNRDSAAQRQPHSDNGNAGSGQQGQQQQGGRDSTASNQAQVAAVQELLLGALMQSQAQSNVAKALQAIPLLGSMQGGAAGLLGAAGGLSGLEALQMQMQVPGLQQAADAGALLRSLQELGAKPDRQGLGSEVAGLKPVVAPKPEVNSSGLGNTPTPTNNSSRGNLRGLKEEGEGERSRDRDTPSRASPAPGSRPPTRPATGTSPLARPSAGKPSAPSGLGLGLQGRTPQQQQGGLSLGNLAALGGGLGGLNALLGGSGGLGSGVPLELLQLLSPGILPGAAAAAAAAAAVADQQAQAQAQLQLQLLSQLGLLGPNAAALAGLQQLAALQGRQEQNPDNLMCYEDGTDAVGHGEGAEGMEGSVLSAAQLNMLLSRHSRQQGGLGSLGATPRAPSGAGYFDNSPRLLSKRKRTPLGPFARDGDDDSDSPPPESERQHSAGNKRNWTQQESDFLTELVNTYGEGKWCWVARDLNSRFGSVPEMMRTSKQCRERWLHHLKPNLSKKAWTEEEERILVRSHRELGNRWSDIAKLLPGRSENTIKNHWNTALRRKHPARYENMRVSVLDKYQAQQNFKVFPPEAQAELAADGEDDLLNAAETLIHQLGVTAAGQAAGAQALAGNTPKKEDSGRGPQGLLASSALGLLLQQQQQQQQLAAAAAAAAANAAGLGSGTSKAPTQNGVLPVSQRPRSMHRNNSGSEFRDVTPPSSAKAGAAGASSGPFTRASSFRGGRGAAAMEEEQQEEEARVKDEEEEEHVRDEDAGNLDEEDALSGLAMLAGMAAAEGSGGSRGAKPQSGLGGRSSYGAGGSGRGAASAQTPLSRSSYGAAAPSSRGSPSISRSHPGKAPPQGLRTGSLAQLAAQSPGVAKSQLGQRMQPPAPRPSPRPANSGGRNSQGVGSVQLLHIGAGRSGGGTSPLASTSTPARQRGSGGGTGQSGASDEHLPDPARLPGHARAAAAAVAEAGIEERGAGLEGAGGGRSSASPLGSAVFSNMSGHDSARTQLAAALKAVTQSSLSGGQ